MPRWVRAFVVVAAALIVLLLIAILAGGGHGPGRHGAAGPPAGRVETNEQRELEG